MRAMESEVRVGERKPTREKMVAEKYIREFWGGKWGLVVWICGKV